ncbi:MAG: TolC family protein [Ignavibacteria bacterium]|nr:TolC family protein [Ignavibacteria bacterium]
MKRGGLWCCLFLFPTLAFAQQGGLTLEQALSRALAHNERALGADERVDASLARVSKVRAAFLPSLSVVGNYTRRAFGTVRTVGSDEVTIQSLNALSATANASMTLLDPRLFAVYGQALSDRDATAADARGSTRALAFEAATAFLAALNAAQVADASERRLDFARKNLDASKARYDAGLASVNDVTRAELELATSDRARSNARGAGEIAMLQLGYLVNDRIEAPLASPDALLAEAAGPPPPVDQLAVQALELRPDLAAARARAAGLHYSAKEAALRFFPSLGAVYQYRMTNEAGLSGRSTNWFVGANLTWNLFDGGIWVSDNTERNALARAAELEVTAAERKVAVDIRSALVALGNAQAAIRQAGVGLEAARRNATESLGNVSPGTRQRLAGCRRHRQSLRSGSGARGRTIQPRHRLPRPSRRRRSRSS